MSDVERIKHRIEKEQKFDEELWNTEANQDSQIDKAIHDTRNSLYRTIFSILDEELTKEPQECNSDLISKRKLIDSFNASINTGYETFSHDLIVEAINNQPQVQPIVITQADRIRNMSDEELADIIFSSCIDRVNDLMCDDIKQADGNCHKCVLKWLKSEVKEV